jgi:mono/diheme cytochrome c family protein
MFLWILLLAQPATPAHAQVDRGQALFADAKSGCASCHALKNSGTAVGPDLKGMARLSPQAIAMAVHSSATQYVQTVKLKTGESFPAMPGADDGKTVQMFDLSKNPPEARKIDKADIASTSGNDKWKHPPMVNKLADDALADIVAYIRFAGGGIRKEVSQDEVK